MPASYQQIIEDAANQIGVDPTSMLAIAQIESGFNPNATNPNSGAAGLFQFMPATAAQYGLTDAYDPVANAMAAAQLARDNGRALTRTLGRDPTVGELYLAHQQGAGGARALLSDPQANVVDALSNVYGSRSRARAAVRQNGGDTGMTAGQFASLWTSRADRIAGRIPPEDIPDNPLAVGTDLASVGAGRVPLPFSGPLTPESMRGSGIPQSAMYGIRRLVPGQRTDAPTDFTTADVGAPIDDRTMQLAGPLRLGAGLNAAGGALKKPVLPAKMPPGIAAGRAAAVAPTPMPGRPGVLSARTQAVAASSAPAKQRQSAAPQQPAQQMVRLASGKMVQTGIMQGSNGPLQVSDDGRGNAVITKIRSPMSIPGVIDPLREVNSDTVAGGLIRSQLPKFMAQGVDSAKSGFAAAGDNLKTSALDAANGLGKGVGDIGNQIGGIGSSIGSAFGSMFGGGSPAYRKWGAPTVDETRTEQSASRLKAVKPLVMVAPKQQARPMMLGAPQPMPGRPMALGAAPVNRGGSVLGVNQNQVNAVMANALAGQRQIPQTGQLIMTDNGPQVIGMRQDGSPRGRTITNDSWFNSVTGRG